MSDDTGVEAPDITEQVDEILTIDDEYYTTDNVALIRLRKRGSSARISPIQNS